MKGIAGWFKVRGSRFEVRGSRCKVQGCKFTVHGKRLADIAPGYKSGQALLLVLILLMVGSLVIGPLLGFVSTELTAGPVFEERTLQFYAADAGVTLAQWHLLQGGLAVPVGGMEPLGEFHLNNKDVNVTITRPDRPDADLIFEITSIATTPGGSSTTVISRVEATFVPPPPCVDHWDHYELSGLVAIDVDVVVHTTVHLQGGSYIKGNLTAGGNVTLSESYTAGNVHTGRNVTLTDNSSITGNVIALGAISLTNSSITGNVHTGGNLTLTDNSSIASNVIALGAISLTNSSIEGNVFVGGSLYSLYMCGESEIEANVYVSCDDELARISKDRDAGRIDIEGYTRCWSEGECPSFPTPTSVLTLSWVIL